MRLVPEKPSGCLSVMFNISFGAFVGLVLFTHPDKQAEVKIPVIAPAPLIEPEEPAKAYPVPLYYKPAFA